VTPKPGSTVNALEEVAEPPESVTVIVPVAAVFGTVAWMVFDDETEINVLATPPKLTVAGATKLVPVIVTVELNMPEAGENPLIVGAAANALPAQSEISAIRKFFGFTAFIGSGFDCILHPASCILAFCILS
jgi:hypothetical protein